MSTKNKTRRVKKSRTPANLVWFEIPADKPERAQKFYRALFGWKIKPFPGMKEYWHIDTGGADASPDGGMLTRKHPGHSITNYILVPSVDKAADRIVKLGGSICMPKTAVPKTGYFVIANDTEGNTFAVWEVNPKAG